jgi:hypothetical protein
MYARLHEDTVEVLDFGGALGVKTNHTHFVV